MSLSSGTRTQAVTGDNKLVGSPFWFMVQFANVTAVLVYVRDDLKKCGSIL